MTESTEVIVNPFGSASAAAQGNAVAVVEQQRAVAEVQAAMVIARANPRDPVRAVDAILQDFTRPSLAEHALYSYSRGGSDITGPSIRTAEVIAQRWGNMQYGVRELEQRQGMSVMQAYAWDMQSNTRREMTFNVAHIRSTKKGSYALEDPRDIYELVANQGARRVRACILGVIPGDVIEAAVKQAERTLTLKTEITPELIDSLLESFGKFGVTKQMIETRIQRRLDAITPALVVQLKKIYNSMRDGMSTPGEWFDIAPAAQPDAGASATESIKAKLKARKSEAPAAKSTLDMTMTYAQVADMIEKAKTPDELDVARSCIGAVAEEEQRKELAALAQSKESALAK
jgi:hypothetical protein